MYPRISEIRELCLNFALPLVFLYCTFYWIAIIVYCDREIKFKTGNIWAHHLYQLYSRGFLIFPLFYYYPFRNGYDEFPYQMAILITLFPQNECSTFKHFLNSMITVFQWSTLYCSYGTITTISSSSNLHFAAVNIIIVISMFVRKLRLNKVTIQ